MPRLRSRLAIVAACAALAPGCGNDRLRRAGEPVEAVSGDPAVGHGQPSVDRLDGGTGPSFGSAAPFQVEAFVQPPLQKVDILWIIDNSFSMQAKQDRVKANFVSFMQFLTDQHIDFHLGVVTTDVFEPTQSGRLVNDAGLARPWIDASTPNPQVAFVANASVGAAGSGDEKPLLAAMMALTPPLSPLPGSAAVAGAGNCVAGGADCFLRADALLYTIVVSDEEDSSCAPINAAQEGCDEAAASVSGFGSIQYWSRFYAGAKGAGRTSRLAAIVANEDTRHDCGALFSHLCDPYHLAGACSGSVPDCAVGSSSHPCCQALRGCQGDLAQRAQYCHFNLVTDATGHGVAPFFSISGSFQGCVATGADGGVDFTAWSADRTAAVAQATGGLATSICQADYTPALARLGLQAAGLRSEFPLSRAPFPPSITVLVAGRPVAPGTSTWQYLDCENHAAANLIRFAGPPAAGAKVQVSYNVNVRGLGCP